MDLHHFLAVAFSFLTAGVMFVLLFKRLGLSSVLGYMAAGAAIGPWGFAAVSDVSRVSNFAELGVVLLLFVIGLELQPKKIWSMRRAVFGLGGLQVVLTSIVMSALLLMAGLEWNAALVCGFALSLSSTAFALQILQEKKEMRTHQGQSAFSILLFQDLVAIPFLTLIPLLAVGEGSTQALAKLSWMPVIKVFALILVVVMAGRFLLRPLLRIIAWTQTKEIFTSAALLVVIGVALIMEHQGLSMALGSFLAGVLLADSEYRHEIEADIEPFKGLLLGLFFISVGMSVDFGLVAGEFLPILSGALILMLLKAGITAGLGRLFGMSWNTARPTGVVVSQAGEFGFVIFTAARGAGVLGAYEADILVAIVILSMVLTPLFVWIEGRFVCTLNQTDTLQFDAIADDSPQVIIAGYGRVGQIMGRILRGLWVPHTALELDSEHVETVRRFGTKIYFGDASRMDLLEAAGAAKAEIFFLAVDDPESSLGIAKKVREHFPHLKIIARARNRQHVFDLLDLGVSHIFRETLSSSLEMAELVLNQIGMPAEKARSTITAFRAHDEKTLIEQHARHHDEKELISFSKQATEQLERTLRDDLAEPGR